MEELLPKVDNWYEFLSVHKEMLEDSVRINSYKRAISSCVKPGDVVVDLGTGTGILAFFAVQAGASRVYAIESANIIRLAERLAVKNGMDGGIKFIQANSQRTDLPERADVLLSEVIGHCVFEENMLDAVIDARKRFLKPNGRMIPKSVDMYFAPAQDDEAYDDMSFWKGTVAGIDLSPAWEKLANSIYVGRHDRSSFLASPGVVLSADLRTVDRADIKGSIDFRCSRDGTLHGFICWFEALLSDGVVLSTSPDDPPTHWQSAYFPLGTPIVVEKGEVIRFECACSSRSGSTDWEWRGAVLGSKDNLRALFSHSTEAYLQ